MNKIAVTFPGQGAQYAGMGKELCSVYPEAEAVFKRADAVLGNISQLCFEGTAEELGQAQNTQPCLLTYEIAVWEMLCKKNLQCDVVSGFSLGEYAALVAAQVLSFEDALQLVRMRATFMQEAVEETHGGMLVLKVDDAQAAQQLCAATKQQVWPANINAPGQVVAAGTEKGIATLKALADEKGILNIPVAISTPSHCPLMETAAQKLGQMLKMISFSDPKMPIITNIDGKVTTSGSMLKEKLVRQLTNPIYFNECCKTMYEMDVRTFVETGPGKVLTGLVKKNLKGIANDYNAELAQAVLARL